MIGEIDDLSVMSSRAEIVKKPSNLPQVQVQHTPQLLSKSVFGVNNMNNQLSCELLI